MPLETVIARNAGRNGGCLSQLQSELFDRGGPAHEPDPEAEAFTLATTAQARRAQGVTFTPPWLVERMLQRAAACGEFDTVVDAGAGSGRFSLAAAARFPRAQVLAVEANEVLAAGLRAKLHRLGLAQRVEVLTGDYRTLSLPLRGRTLFVGNPPYVRHHDIAEDWKRWYGQGMAALGIAASQLAGLHAHFMLRSRQLMRPGDVLCIVTAAEWLDNGYGSALRHLWTADGAHGLRRLWLAAADEPVFPDALVSAVVVECGGVPDDRVGLGRIVARGFAPTRELARAELRAAPRWSALCQPGMGAPASGIELGELFRVTRGQVTGMNEAWILPADAPAALHALGVPAVTRAREIIDGTVLEADARARLRQVIDLPVDLEGLAHEQRAAADEWVAHARRLGADRSYVARQRKAWYAVGMREPPAAFVSYMGRRPPVFRPNPQRVSYLNIAHGLYPRLPLGTAALRRILDHLNRQTGIYSGRVYGGGLAKFEPGDVARLRLPDTAWSGVA